MKVTDSLSLALAGAAGGGTRWWLDSQAVRLLPDVFPWATLFCNLLGSFLLAWLLFGMAEGRSRSSVRLRLVVGTGFLGSFTTFSALSLESLMLLTSSQVWLAALYLCGSAGGGLLFAWIGCRLARRVNAQRAVEAVKKATEESETR